MDAEEAAREAAEKHRHWWVERTARRHRKGSRIESHDLPDNSLVEPGTDSDNEDGEGWGGGCDGDLDCGLTKRRKRRSRIGRGQEKSLDRTAKYLLKSLTPLPHMLVYDQQIGLVEAKVNLMKILSQSGGFFDVSNKASVAALDRLVGLYRKSGIDARQTTSQEIRGYEKDVGRMDGAWLSLCRPNYDDCRGHNASGESLYSLGRMSFDMFRPTGLICSVRGIFNSVDPVEDGPEYVPHSLKGKLKGDGRNGGSGDMDRLRTYK